MPDAQVLQQLAGLMTHVFAHPVSNLQREMAFADIDGWTSLGHATLIVTVEQHYGISVPDARIFDLHCVGDLVDAVLQGTGCPHG